MTRHVMAMEWLRLRRSRAALGVLAFALLASCYAVWSGFHWSHSYRTIQQAYEASIAEEMLEWRNALTDIEQGSGEASPYDARPLDIQFPATHPLGALSHLAIGYRDITPPRLKISGWRNELSMVEPYEFDNPMMLSLGRFDLAFFVVIVLPVLMIALSFDVIAADRSTGRDRLLLSNPISLNRLILARLLVRNGALCGLVLLSTAVGFVLGEGARITDSLLWTGISLGSMAFWLGLSFLIVSRLRRSEAVATSLVASWVLIVFAVPAMVDAAVEAAYPPPSKLAYLSVARLAQGETNKKTDELSAGFLADHPELSVGDEQVPDYYRRTFLANEKVREQTAPIVAAFRASAERRETLVDVAQFLSPATVAQRAMYGVAQSDKAASRRFQALAAGQLAGLADALRPAVISRNRISVREFDALPPFSMAGRAHGAATVAQVAFLAIVAAGLFLGALRSARSAR